MNGRKDSYPYNVDTVAMSEDVLSKGSFQDKVGALKNGHYGSILMTLYRGEGSTDYGRVTNGGMNADHRLIFGGVPSTEIASIILRDVAEHEKRAVINSVVEHGFYIPIYDTDGSLLLTPDGYDEARMDGNYDAARPEIVDGAFEREGTQRGSNEGAWFVMPKNGDAEHWYVKFGDASPEKAVHVWNELLADSLYRRVVPDLVPETKGLIVEGRFARGSKSVDLDEGASVTEDARNKGAIMDMFLGNWDAVYNSNNLVMTVDGRAMRIDTGNALDFRARGDKKEADQFGPIVHEVEFGDDGRRLGGGMRQMYPGLTDEAIREQVMALRDRLDDDTIDGIVDSVRRSKDDRGHLKATLKARRDDLIRRFL